MFTKRSTDSIPQRCCCSRVHHDVNSSIHKYSGIKKQRFFFTSSMLLSLFLLLACCSSSITPLLYVGAEEAVPTATDTPTVSPTVAIFPSKNTMFKTLVTKFKRSENNTGRAFIHYLNYDGLAAIRQVTLERHYHFRNESLVIISINVTGLLILQEDPNIDIAEFDSEWKTSAENEWDEKSWNETHLQQEYSNDEQQQQMSPNATSSSRRLNAVLYSITHGSEIIPYGITLVEGTRRSYNKNTNNPAVCVIDSGVHKHHGDLNPFNIMGKDRIVRGVVTPWSVDSSGHGTHVIGTIAAKANNKYGVRGIDSNIPIYVVPIGEKILQSDIFYSLKACESSPLNVRVINLSLSGTEMTGSLKVLVDRLYNDRNMVLVAAAGNDGKFVSRYPASYNKVISVAAVDSRQMKWTGSNSSPEIELAAPGVDVWSTFVSNDIPTFSANRGTSMAVPHVSAIVAILFSHFPLCSNSQIRFVLARTAKDIAPAGCDTGTGFGIVQLDKAFRFLSLNRCTQWSTKLASGCNI